MESRSPRNRSNSGGRRGDKDGDNHPFGGSKRRGDDNEGGNRGSDRRGRGGDRNRGSDRRSNRSGSGERKNSKTRESYGDSRRDRDSGSRRDRGDDRGGSRYGGGDRRDNRRGGGRGRSYGGDRGGSRYGGGDRGGSRRDEPQEKRNRSRSRSSTGKSGGNSGNDNRGGDSRGGGSRYSQRDSYGNSGRGGSRGGSRGGYGGGSRGGYGGQQRSFGGRDQGGSRYDSRGGGGGYGGGDSYSQSGFGGDLRQIDWSNTKTSQLKKDFYVEDDKVKNRDPEKIKAYRVKHEIVVQSGYGAIPNPVMYFDEIQFPSRILDKFDRMGFQEPSPIQAQGWPIALKGHDMIGIAKTGSGKTLAFLMPAFRHINAQPPLQRGDGPVGLIIAPTRELAQQIFEECNKFGRAVNISATCVYGGAPKYHQRMDLLKGKHIVVATPGRLIDFLSSNVTNLERVSYLVLDEADRMLDMGFEPQIRQICSQIRPDRQTLLYSATWPEEIRKLANDLCKQDPVKCRVGPEELAVTENVTQKIIFVNHYEKMHKLEELLRELENQKMLVFCQMKRTCDTVAEQLKHKGFRVCAIHGNKSQQAREYVLNSFKSGRTKILLATDVASRGIDVKDINVVINYDFPMQIEDYVHRVGRTGRANAKGTSYTFFSDEENKHARKLIKILETTSQEIPYELENRGRNFRGKGGNNRRFGGGRGRGRGRGGNRYGGGGFNRGYGGGGGGGYNRFGGGGGGRGRGGGRGGGGRGRGGYNPRNSYNNRGQGQGFGGGGYQGGMSRNTESTNYFPSQKTNQPTNYISRFTSNPSYQAPTGMPANFK